MIQLNRLNSTSRWRGSFSMSQKRKFSEKFQIFWNSKSFIFIGVKVSELTSCYYLFMYIVLLLKALGSASFCWPIWCTSFIFVQTVSLNSTQRYQKVQNPNYFNASEAILVTITCLFLEKDGKMCTLLASETLFILNKWILSAILSNALYWGFVKRPKLCEKNFQLSKIFLKRRLEANLRSLPKHQTSFSERFFGNHLS